MHQLLLLTLYPSFNTLIMSDWGGGQHSPPTGQWMSGFGATFFFLPLPHNDPVSIASTSTTISFLGSTKAGDSFFLI